MFIKVLSHIGIISTIIIRILVTWLVFSRVPVLSYGRKLTPKVKPDFLNLINSYTLNPKS